MTLALNFNSAGVRAHQNLVMSDRLLSASLARLTPSQRLVVVLRDVFGMTYEEISRSASMPVGTAKCYVHRAHARLRVRLEEAAGG